MTPVLAPDARDRLAKLLGMLGSDHPGERAAAGLNADQLVRGLGRITLKCRLYATAGEGTDEEF